MLHIYREIEMEIERERKKGEREREKKKRRKGAEETFIDTKKDNKDNK